MTATTERPAVTDVYALIDGALAELRNINIANAKEMVDVLLDIRLLIAQVVEN